MRKDTVVQLRQPGTFSEDPLTEVLRLGARAASRSRMSIAGQWRVREYGAESGAGRRQSFRFEMEVTTFVDKMRRRRS